MNVATIRSDIKLRLQAIGALQVYDVVPAKPEVPCVIVHLEQIDTHAAFDAGTVDIRFGLQILVQLGDWETAQRQLDGYISTGTPTSVGDAFEQGVASVSLDMIDSYGHIAIGDVDYATVTIHVLVLTSS